MSPPTRLPTTLLLGLTSLTAEGLNSHPILGKGVDGFYAYTWRGFLDKTDGTYLSAWLLPSLLHEDTRYYALGDGHTVIRRALYVISREAVARTYVGSQTRTSPVSAARSSPRLSPVTTTHPAQLTSASSPPSSATRSCAKSPSLPFVSSTPTSPLTTSASIARKQPELLLETVLPFPKRSAVFSRSQQVSEGLHNCRARTLVTSHQSLRSRGF